MGTQYSLLDFSVPKINRNHGRFFGIRVSIDILGNLSLIFTEILQIKVQLSLTPIFDLLV
jgi:hypothetical protein